MKFHFSAINLWCNKNLVDLEFTVWEILKLSNIHDIAFFDNPEDELVEYIVINTCGFLSSSRKEAEQTIKKYDKMWKKIILTGCYVSVKDNKFLKSLKNLYSIIDPRNYDSIEDLLKNSDSLSTEKINPLKNCSSSCSSPSPLKGEGWGESINTKAITKLKTGLSKLKEKQLNTYLKSIWWENNNKAFIWKWDEIRAYFNGWYSYEYLKIAEWCDNSCLFCIIPKIRGKQNSRKIEDILKEVKIMVANWIKEIEIIAQDTTRYWTDLYWETSLIKLLKEIDSINLGFKYRVFYMYPDSMTLGNLKSLTKLKKFIPYFDIPFQHISPNILKRMWRFYDDKHIYKLLDFIKQNFPWAFLHTNFIVWYPWETEEDFQMLLDFIKKYEFDSVSLFGYHDEPLAASSKLDGKIDEDTIKERVEEVSILLDQIYDKKEEKRKWKKFTWYIMDILESWKLIIRPEIKAPEIDEYDAVKPKNVLEWNINLGEKVKYIL